MKDHAMSCCGELCAHCDYLPQCGGCAGQPWWLQFTGESSCPIYECCQEQHRYAHCGQCSELPCALWLRDDPTKSHEENERKRVEQQARLHSLKQKHGHEQK